jgi:hypothetical protein
MATGNSGADRTTTGWLKPPKAIGGLDHLGVQAQCVALYAEMLPGITNVTDRARFFTFHPWFVWALEKRLRAVPSEPEHARWLRAAECLVTLIAIRHRETTGESAEIHDVATPGSSKLGAAYAGLDETGEIDLREYSAFKGERSNERHYLKARWGGLDQYIGSLIDLRLMDQTEHAPRQPGYGKRLGAAAAHVFAQGVPGDRFFEVLERGRVTVDELDALSAFCPCQIKHREHEREFLTELMFARRADAQDDGREERRDSLLLLLELAKISEPERLEWTLRASAYSGCFPADEPWSLSAGLERTRKRWRTYHRNELFSVALQGVFWVVLQAVERRLRGRLRSVAAAGDLLVAIASESALAESLRLPFDAFVDGFARDLPSIGAWEDPKHEHHRAYEIVDIARTTDVTDDESLISTLEQSVGVLATLIARRRESEPENPYADFALKPRTGDELDLASLESALPTWAGLSLEEWLRWVATNWGVRRHLQVALRKLHQGGQDTFRLRPIDEGLQFVEVAPASFTGPRVNKAQQLLVDLGLIARAEDGLLRITALGEIELELGRHV